MQNFVAGLFRAFVLCMSPEGGGPGGGGAPAGGGQPGAGGAPGAGGQPGGGGAPGGGAAAPKLTDDFTFEVDGKTTRWGDYKSQFVPREQHEAFAKDFQSNFSANLKRGLANLQQRLGQQPGGGQPGGQPGARPGGGLQALMAKVSDMPFVDGATLKALTDEGFAPLANVVNQQQRALQQLINEVKSLKGNVGSVRERNATGDFANLVNTAIGTLGEDVDVKDPFVAELAQDVYHSHTGWKNIAKEFPVLLKQRYDAAVAHVRAVDKVRLEKRKKMPFNFPRPGGGGNPNGNEPFKPPSNREIAQRAFAHRAGANT